MSTAALPPPLPWPADLSCHPCVRGEHEKCPEGDRCCPDFTPDASTPLPYVYPCVPLANCSGGGV